MNNNTPLISHEIPKALFPQHHFVNDYPYLLCHLLHFGGPHFDPAYATFYKEIVKEYEYSILDNSAFELGDSYDPNILFEIGEQYKPSHLILPDALHNKALTQARALAYIAKFGGKSTPKFIGVLQGKSIEEFVELYNFYCTVDEIEVIAVPFDLFTKEEYDYTTYKIYDNIDYKLHRVAVISDLISKVEMKKPLHLLGCATPKEFTLYPQRLREYIKSVDTSAPIVYGWNGIKFETNINLDLTVDKPKEKLAENLDIVLQHSQVSTIAYNVRQFRTNLFNK